MSVRAGRVVLFALGGLALVRGAWLLLFDVPPRDWPYVLLWLSLGVVVHDGLLAPMSAAVGGAAVPRLPERWRWVVRGAWLAAGSVLLVGLPLVVGARHRANPSVIPQDPVASLALAVALVLAGAIVTGLGLVLRDRAVRAGEPDDAGPGRPDQPPATPH